MRLKMSRVHPEMMSRFDDVMTDHTAMVGSSALIAAETTTSDHAGSSKRKPRPLSETVMP